MYQSSIRSRLKWSSAALALAISGASHAQSVELPTGGQVIAGTASIGLPSGNQLTIDQSSARAVIDWQGFSIGAGGTVQFNNGSGATLNRVLGGDPSSIAGQLRATGSLYLVNPAGIVVNASGKVVTGGSFVASTRALDASGFMAGGAQSFVGSSLSGVTNAGTIEASADAVLIGHIATNSGTVKAGGTAGLATGTRVVLQAAGSDGRIFVEGASGDVSNSGGIAAASAELRAAGGNVYALAGNSGLVRATGTEVRGGRVWLTAAKDITVESGAVIDASAKTATGSGGDVIVFAQGALDFRGAALARGGAAGGDGGFVETSARGNLNLAGRVDAGAAAGKAGNWLIDPYDLTIDATAAGLISTALATTNVTLLTDNSNGSGYTGFGTVNGSGNGDITINAAIGWSAATTLTLNAWRNIAINAEIVGNLTTSALTLNAGQGNAAGTIAQTAAIWTNALTATTQGGAIALTHLGADGDIDGTRSNSFSTFSASTSGGAVTVNTRKGYAVAGIAAGSGAVTLTSHQALFLGSEITAITQSGAITAGALTVNNLRGAINLGTHNNSVATASFTALGLSSNEPYDADAQTPVSGSAISFRADGGFALGRIDAAGSGGLAHGAVTLTTDGGAITQAADKQLFAGAVSIATNGGAVSLAGTNAIESVSIDTRKANATGGATTLNLASGDAFTNRVVFNLGGDALRPGASTVLGATPSITQIATRSPTGGTAANVTLTTAGPLTQTGAITAATLAVTTTSGNVTLTNAANDVTNFNAQATSGNVDYVDATGINVTGANATTGDLKLTATTGNITQSGPIGVDVLNVTTNGGSITLNQVGDPFPTDINRVETLIASTGGGALTFKTRAGFKIGGINAGSGAVTLVRNNGATDVNGQQITQTGAITAGALTVANANGAINLSTHNNSVTSVSLTSFGFSPGQPIDVDSGPTLGGSASFRADAGFALGTVDLGDTSTRSLTLLTDGGAITRVASTNLIAGQVSITTNGGAVSLTGANAVDTLSIDTGRNNAVGGAVTVNLQTVTLTAPRPTVFDDPFFAGGPYGTAPSIGTVNTRGATGGTAASVSLTRSGGGLSAGAVTASALSVTAAGAIDVTNGGNALDSFAATTTTGNVSVRDDSGFALAATNIGTGTLTVAAGTGALTQTGGVTAGTLTISNAGAVTLNNGSNAISNLSATTVGSLSLTTATALTLPSLTTTAGGISVTTTGAASDLTLGSTGGVGHTLQPASSQTVSLSAGRNLSIDGRIEGGTTGAINLAAGTTTASGTISQAGGLVASRGLFGGALSLTTAGGNALINGLANSVASASANTGAGSFAIDNGSNNLGIAGITAGSVSFGGTGGATISQTGAITTGNLLVFAAVNIDFTGATNMIDAIGTIGTSAVSLKNGKALSLGHSGALLTASGAINIETTGHAVTDFGVVTAGSLGIVTNGGAVTFDAQNAVSGTTTIDTGQANGAGGAVSITRPTGALTIGNVNTKGSGTGTAANVTLTTTGADIGQVNGTTLTANDVTATTTSTGGNITLGNANSVTGYAATTFGTGTVSLRDDGGFTANTIATGTGAVALTTITGGAITQGGGTAITTGGQLNVSVGGGSATLANSGNAVGSFAATGTAATAAVDFRDNGGFAVVASNLGGGSLTLRTLTGEVTQTSSGANILAGTLNLHSGSGRINLNADTDVNDVTTLTATTTGGHVVYFDSGAFTVGTSNVGAGVFFLRADAAVTQSGVITADALGLGGTGSFDFGTQANLIGGISGQELGNVTLRNGQALTLGADFGDGDIRNFNSTGTLTLDVTGALSQVTQVSTAGTLAITSNGSTVSLNHNANDEGDILTNRFGTLSITGAGSSSVTARGLDGSPVVMLGTINTGANAFAFNSFGDAVAQSGPGIVAGALSVTTAGGAVTLTNSANNVASVAIDTRRNGGAGGAVSYSEATSYEIFGIRTRGTGGTAAAITLSTGATALAGGGAGQEIVASTLTLAGIGGVGTFDLYDSNNDIASLSASGATNVWFEEANGYDVAGIAASGSVNLVIGGATVTQSGAIVTPRLDLDGSGAATFNLASVSNSISELGVRTTGGAAAVYNIRDDNGFAVMTVGGAGTVNVQAGSGNVTQTVAANGRWSVQTTGDWVFTNNGNGAGFGLTLLASTARDITINGASLSVGNGIVSATQNLVLRTDIASIAAGGGSLAGGTSVTIEPVNTNTALFLGTTGAGLQLSAADLAAINTPSLILGNATGLGLTTTGTFTAQNEAGKTLTLRNARGNGAFGITAAATGGTITTETLVAQTNGGAISLEVNGADHRVTNVQLTTNGAGGSGTAAFRDTSGFNINGIATGNSGAFLFTGAGNVTQTGAITVGTADLDVTTTTGNITLTNAGNAFAGLVASGGGGSVSVADSRSLNIRTINLGAGNLTVSNTATINGAGVITAGTLTASTTSGAIGLNNANHNVTAVSFSNSGSGDVRFRDDNGFNLLGINAGSGTGNVTLTANGALAPVTQSGAIQAAGLFAFGDAAFTLTNTGNAIGALAGSLGSIALETGGALTLGFADTNLSASGVVNLRAGGNISVARSTSSTASGDAIMLASGGTFSSTSASHLNTANGRSLVFLSDPSKLGLTNAPAFKTIYGTPRGVSLATVPTVTPAGSRYVFANTPTLRFRPTNASVTYNGNTQTATGLDAPIRQGTVNVDYSAFDDPAELGTLAGATFGGGRRNAGTGITTITGGTFSSAMGYANAGFDTGDISVSARGITVSAATVAPKVYDGTTASNVAPTVTVGGLVGTDSFTTLAQAYQSKNVLGTNGSTITPTAVINDGNGGGNYTVTLNTAAGTITPKDVTISAITANDKIFDGNTTATLSGGTSSGFVTGDSIGITAAAGTFDTRNVGTAKTVTISGLSLTGTDAPNYNLIGAPSTTTARITARPITVTGVTVADKVYDGTSAATAQIGGSPAVATGVAGESFAVDGGGASATFAQINVGTGIAVTAAGYALGAGGGGALASNYSLSQPTGLSANITQRSITVTATAGSKIYDGTASSALVPTITAGTVASGESLSGLVQSYNSADVAAATTLTAAVGGVSGGQASLANYTITLNTAAGSITPRPLTVTANDIARVYGAADPTLTFGVSNIAPGQTRAQALSGAITRASGLNAGSHPITQGTLAATPNYSIASFTPGTFTITPAVLTVTGNSVTRLYGDTNPALTATLTGFVAPAPGGLVDTAAVLSGAPTVATTATAASNVGSVAVTPSGGAAANYMFAYVDGALTVTPAPLAVAAVNGTKVYGTADPALGFNATGFKNGQTAAIVTGTQARAAGANVGSYAITQGTLGAGGNYTITYTPGVFAIMPATLTFAVGNSAATFGTLASVGPVTLTGVVQGDTVSGVTQVRSGTTPVTLATSTAAGSYTSTVTGITGTSAGNYVLAQTGNTNGLVTVNRAILTAVVGSANRLVGQPNPSIPVTLAGATGGDTAASLASLVSVTGLPATDASPGNYALNASAAAGLSNYTLTVTPGTLVVNPAPTQQIPVVTPPALSSVGGATGGTTTGAGAQTASFSPPAPAGGTPGTATTGGGSSTTLVSGAGFTVGVSTGGSGGSGSGSQQDTGGTGGQQAAGGSGGTASANSPGVGNGGGTGSDGAGAGGSQGVSGGGASSFDDGGDAGDDAESSQPAAQ